MIRVFLIAVFLIVFFLLSIPVFLIEWIIGKFNPRVRDISSLRIVQGAFKVVIFLSGVKLTVSARKMFQKISGALHWQPPKLL